MNEQGADVVFQVAGGTGEGVIVAADEGGFFAVGVDSDQDYLAPGAVLTSMMKRVDVAVYDVIRQAVEGTLQGGTVQQYGLEEEGVGLSEMTYTRHIISPSYMDQIEAAREGILAGDIEVIDVRLLDADTFSYFAQNATCAGIEEVRAMMEASQ
jgi:basic membrane protein A